MNSCDSFWPTFKSAVRSLKTGLFWSQVLKNGPFPHKAAHSLIQGHELHLIAKKKKKKALWINKCVFQVLSVPNGIKL